MVISFEGYQPPPRFDALAWVAVRIEESVSRDGPWVEVETITLAPPELDPADPIERAFTTQLATDTAGLWYRVVFVDVDGDESLPSSAVQNGVGDLLSDDGPCQTWISASEVDCIDADDTVRERLAAEASYVLFKASGSRFGGLCGPVTVRPCSLDCGCLPRDGWSRTGACWLSRVRLAGYPVRAVSEVKVDGVVLDPTEYRLDGQRFLTRLPDLDDTLASPERWPRCQRLDLADTEDDTFSITYTYGQDPPLLGQQAAVQLACQIAAADPTLGGGDCDLPAGTTRVTRQGVTIDLEKLAALAETGVPLVDLFLRTVNPNGLRKRPALWSPDVDPFPQRIG